MATTGVRFVADVKYQSTLLVPTDDPPVTRGKTPSRKNGVNLIGVTTGATPILTECVLGTLKHMTVVMVLDARTDRASYANKSANLHVIDWDYQAQLYPSIGIQRGNYALKSLGYLYALQELDAYAIWDFDDDNCVTDATVLQLLTRGLSKSAVRLISDATSDGIVNPYVLYGAPKEYIWPRGIPFESLGRRTPPTLSHANVSMLDVVQVMQSVDPDVDAIWRIQHGERLLPMQWDASATRRAHTVALGSDSWAPFNAQATLLSRRAAQLAYLPSTVHGRVSDIWRSYIMQYLMGTERVGFSGAFVNHFRRAHDYLADMDAEHQLYAQAGALVQYLRSRPLFTEDDASRRITPELYRRLLDDLFVRGFIGTEDVTTGYNWMRLAIPDGVFLQRDYTSNHGVSNLTDSHPVCRLSEVDIFVVAHTSTFPMLETLLRSVETFMPCHGDIHIVADPEHIAEVRIWSTAGRRVRIHPLDRPQTMANVEGYNLQNWIMLWADAYASPHAKYMMYMDTDALITLPITCRTLFDTDGRLNLPAWDIGGTAPHFRKPCRDFMGVDCPVNYMAYFPFTIPVKTLSGMRAHMAETRNSASFDDAFAAWHADYDRATQFSQFVIMGTYLSAFTDSVHVITCPPLSKLTQDDECANYVHPGIHYGWRTCQYLGACQTGREGHQIMKGPGTVFQYKFSMEMMRYHEEVLTHGYCYMQRLSNSGTLALGCDLKRSSSIHPETLTYPTRQVNMDIQDLKFTPDGYCA